MRRQRKEKTSIRRVGEKKTKNKTSNRQNKTAEEDTGRIVGKSYQ